MISSLICSPVALDMCDVEYSTTRKGKPLLISNGYTYRVHRVKENVTAWICSKQKKSRCPGSLRTSNKDQKVIAGSGRPHVCVASDVEIEIRKRLASCRKRAIEDISTPVPIIFHQEFQELKEKYQDYELPKYDNFKGNLYMLRRKAMSSCSEYTPSDSKDLKERHDTKASVPKFENVKRKLYKLRRKAKSNISELSRSSSIITRKILVTSRARNVVLRSDGTLWTPKSSPRAYDEHSVEEPISSHPNSPACVPTILPEKKPIWTDISLPMHQNVADLMNMGPVPSTSDALCKDTIKDGLPVQQKVAHTNVIDPVPSTSDDTGLVVPTEDEYMVEPTHVASIKCEEVFLSDDEENKHSHDMPLDFPDYIATAVSEQPNISVALTSTRTAKESPEPMMHVRESEETRSNSTEDNLRRDRDEVPSSVDRSQDVNELFAKYLTAELQSLPPEAAALLRKKIHCLVADFMAEVFERGARASVQEPWISGSERSS